jgi:hypothetical protein
MSRRARRSCAILSPAARLICNVTPSAVSRTPVDRSSYTLMCRSIDCRWYIRLALIQGAAVDFETPQTRSRFAHGAVRNEDRSKGLSRAVPADHLPLARATPARTGPERGPLERGNRSQTCICSLPERWRRADVCLRHPPPPTRMQLPVGRPICCA